MGEIRLICPGCGAEYRLPPEAIPAEGREVECSACGHLWQARPPQSAPLDLGGFAAGTAAPPPPIPPAAARLPASVLDILREEVEHERRLRAAETEGRQPPVGAPTPARAAAGDAETGDGQGRPAPEADWPATTVILPAGAARAVIAAPQPQAGTPLDHAAVPAPPQPRPAPQTRPEPAAPPVIRHAAHPPAAGSGAAALLRPAMPAPTRGGAVPPPQSQPQPQPAKRRNPARSGFGLAVMLAAACLALYLLAPNLAQSGNPVGQRLMELRQEVDRGRLWLQDLAALLRGPAPAAAPPSS